MISNVWVMVILTGTGRLKTRTIDKSAVVILVGIKRVMMTINEWTACLSINWLNSKKLLSIWEKREGADGRSQEPGARRISERLWRPKCSEGFPSWRGKFCGSWKVILL
jgi:hypothetical protein